MDSGQCNKISVQVLSWNFPFYLWANRDKTKEKKVMAEEKKSSNYYVASIPIFLCCAILRNGYHIMKHIMLKN